MTRIFQLLKRMIAGDPDMLRNSRARALRELLAKSEGK